MTTNVAGGWAITPSPCVDPVISEIRARIQEVFRTDAAFADMFRRPLAPDEPEHPLLERMDAGEFQN